MALWRAAAGDRVLVIEAGVIELVARDHGLSMACAWTVNWAIGGVSGAAAHGKRAREGRGQRGREDQGRAHQKVTSATGAPSLKV
ncbi:hypothetical protein LP419_17150 [Massilia sp. H-1]|nr:hypothetical protein LP419_17150 [Massilia sp. H-1]